MSADVGKTVYGVVPAMTREEYYRTRGDRNGTPVNWRPSPHSRDRLNEPPTPTPIV